MRASIATNLKQLLTILPPKKSEKKKNNFIPNAKVAKIKEKHNSVSSGALAEWGDQPKGGGAASRAIPHSLKYTLLLLKTQRQRQNIPKNTPKNKYTHKDKDSTFLSRLTSSTALVNI